jgi:hypothetical protein
MTESPLQSDWDEHVAWSVTANRLKATRERYRTVVLVLTIAGAALATLAASTADSRMQTTAGILGSVSLGIVPFLTRYFLSAEKTRNWLRARSISEGIKSEIFRYCAGAEPYTGPDARAKLTQKVRTIRDWGRSLEIERVKAIVPRTTPPPKLDAESYVKLRVRQQIDQYYRPKARTFAARSEQFRRAEIGLAAMAAILSSAATYLGGSGFRLGPWVAVLTTVGGSVAAHAAAGRYDFQTTTFFATARQLEDLLHDWEASAQTAPGPEWSDFVQACEEAISAENRGWMAKLDENP